MKAYKVLDIIDNKVLFTVASTVDINNPVVRLQIGDFVRVRTGEIRLWRIL